MGKDPAMPFYVNEWLSSINVTSMSLEEQGAYVRLLCYCWASGDGSIPDSPKSLGQLSGLGEGYFESSSSLLRDRFVEHPEKAGFLTDRKLWSLWQERIEWKEKCAKGGRNSGSTRKNGRNREKPTGKGSSSTVEVPFKVNGQVNGNTPSSSSSSLKPPKSPKGGPDFSESEKAPPPPEPPRPPFADECLDDMAFLDGLHKRCTHIGQDDEMFARLVGLAMHFRKEDTRDQPQSQGFLTFLRSKYFAPAHAEFAEARERVKKFREAQSTGGAA